MESCSPLAREIPLHGHILFHFYAESGLRFSLGSSLYLVWNINEDEYHHIHLASLETGLNHCPWRISVCFPSTENLVGKNLHPPLSGASWRHHHKLHPPDSWGKARQPICSVNTSADWHISSCHWQDISQIERKVLMSQSLPLLTSPGACVSLLPPTTASHPKRK